MLSAVSRVAIIEMTENCSQAQQLTDFLRTPVPTAQRGMYV